MRAAAEVSGTTDSLTLFMNAAGRYQLLTAAEEVALAKRIERGDRTAKELMINSNLRLVVSIAKRYQGRGMQLGDARIRRLADRVFIGAGDIGAPSNAHSIFSGRIFQYDRGRSRTCSAT